MLSGDRLRKWLEAQSQKRLEIRECLRALERLCPEIDFARRRAAMLDALNSLAEAGVIKFAQNRQSWDRTGVPSLPRFITVQRTEPERLSYSNVAWVPALSFASAATRQDQLERLLTINNFLIKSRSHLEPRLPYRERALEIFGDEKAFKNAVRGDMLWDRLPLAAIGAYNPEPPLAREDCNASDGALLIVENLHTYDSLIRWNTQSMRYRSVAYGVGKAILNAVQAVLDAQVRSGATAVEYFGDLDPEGVDIATSLAKRLESHGVRLRPAKALYETLLLMGVERSLAGGELSVDAATWLGGDLAAQVGARFRGQRWLPQEGLSFRVMCSGAIGEGDGPGDP